MDTHFETTIMENALEELPVYIPATPNVDEEEDEVVCTAYGRTPP